MNLDETAEGKRLQEDAQRQAYWKRWGPYVSNRAWGTVREDYSEDGNAWAYFPFEHAHLRAYRWGEDGLLGICDTRQRLCFALALWNEKDPILKERPFGLSGPQGNHGEDVKDHYYYLDATPTHSYLKGLYKYPQQRFPYEELLRVNRRRSRQEFEYELIETGVFDEDRYFDVFVEYAKGSPEDVLIRITVHNRGPEAAPLHVLPTVWFRNTWSWGYPIPARPKIKRVSDQTLRISEWNLGNYLLSFEEPPEFLFTENETNAARLWGQPAAKGYYKDGINRRVVGGREDAVNPEGIGTKACGWYRLILEPGTSHTLRLRLTERSLQIDPAGNFEEIIEQRVAEADEFYMAQIGRFDPAKLSVDARLVERQAYAGLIWTRQFYHLVMEEWLSGDPQMPPPRRRAPRNAKWRQLHNADIISMPDKWEYPWYAVWDSAFHMIPFVQIDPDFAKRQLMMFLREWYMHPNGQIPAYEWNFSDVNPPVHAWACWRVYKIDARLKGKADVDFLESCFHKLLMNFTWWVNRKDRQDNNIFEGGFLGLDNIGLFDRSRPLSSGQMLQQSDATSWVAMYCLDMLEIALELAQEKPAYEDIASKFFEHFLYIASAMNTHGGTGLWDEQDGFYYDHLLPPGEDPIVLRVRSLVGLIPLFAVHTLDCKVLDRLTAFRKRMQWFIENRPGLCANLASITLPGVVERRLLALVPPERMLRILGRMLDENEFLSPFGIRSLSKYYELNPYVCRLGGEEYRVAYEPADSQSGMFGGNSNWRGPVWFPVNYLLIEALDRFHHYYGGSMQVEFPTGSGQKMTLQEVAVELRKRLCRIFLRDEAGRRAAFGGVEKFQTDPHFRDYILFYEYFHGDNGAGIGASHQTGWTALVAKLLQQTGA